MDIATTRKNRPRGDSLKSKVGSLLEKGGCKLNFPQPLFMVNSVHYLYCEESMVSCKQVTKKKLLLLYINANVNPI